MDHKDLCEHTRIRLIAAALGHQQCTKTESNIVPIPGSDRVIAIGMPAQLILLLRGLGDGVAELLDLLKGIRPRFGDVGTRDVDVAAQQQRIDRVVELLERASLPAQPAVDAAAICDGVAAKSRNHLFRSGAKICAGEIRAALAADQVYSEGGHHD